ncbi:MAG: hypothetical protein J7M26_01385, partial [Armatimonadetes bacterium]|nr:hypothetical protein [Armatimonadota bacterium]
MATHSTSPAEPGTRIAPQQGVVSAQRPAGLRREHVEPFVAACFQVLEDLGDLAPQRGPLSMACGAWPGPEDMAVKVETRGAAQAEVYYAMSEAVGLQRAGALEEAAEDAEDKDGLAGALQHLG